jgi:hypothetical protein
MAAALVISAALTSCSDSRDIASPSPSRPVRLLQAPAVVSVLTRDVPLATSVTASATIGALGGTITLPEAGLTVTVPALAVTSPTVISVTAVAGAQVAYEFEPHGLQFAVPLVVTQVLDGTSASGRGLIPGKVFAGYFADLSALNQTNGTAIVNEILGASLNLGHSRATFTVSHFSGYLLATGEGDPGDGGGSH